MKEQRSKICFLEKVTPLSLIVAIRDVVNARTVFYFEKPAPYFLRVIRIFQRFGLFPTSFQKVDNHIGDVRDAAGHSTIFQSQESVANCVRVISCDRASTTVFIRRLDTLWNPKLLTVLFEQSIERKIRPEVFRVDLCRWLAHENNGGSRELTALYISSENFCAVLQKYALEQGLVLKRFPEFPVFRSCWRGVVCMLSLKRVSRLIHVANSFLMRRIFRQPASRAKTNYRVSSDTNEISRRSGAIAVRTNSAGLSLSETQRTEWVWLQALKLDYSHIIIYDYRSRSALDVGVRDYLSKKKVKIYGDAPDVDAWTPTSKCLVTLLDAIRVLGYALLSSLWKRQTIPLSDIKKLLGLAMRYAYWLDFYSSNNVLINVGLTDTVAAQTLALEKLGSISIGYQHSIGFLTNHVPQKYMVSGETIRFIYSKPFQMLFDKAADVQTLFIQTGPIVGSDFRPRTGDLLLAHLRTKILASGATFVLGYFDENSANHFAIAASDEDTTLAYEHLFRWVLRDSTLGLVIKPKNPETLLARISRIQDLVKKGTESGRVCMLGVERGERYYARSVGEISDVCIGHLIGGSAAFEAAQTGVPSILIDELGLPDHDLRKWCSAATVFDSMQDAEIAINQFRNSPKGVARFGDWSNAFEHLDPFGDRKGLFRMTECISELFKSLESGESSSRAVELLAARYVNTWGAKFVGDIEESRVT